MLARLFILFFVIALPLPSAKAAVYGPSQPLSEQSILRGRFIQTHQRRAPRPPIVSEGRFVVAPKFGIIFAYEKPIPLTLIVTPTNIVQTIGFFKYGHQGVDPSIFFNRLSTIINHGLSRRFDKLRPLYKITGEGDPSQWSVYMIPKSPEAGSQYFKAILASGSQFVVRAEILRHDNLYDFFVFSEHSLGDDRPTMDELAFFQLTLPKPKKQ